MSHQKPYNDTVYDLSAAISQSNLIVLNVMFLLLPHQPFPHHLGTC